MQTVGEPGGYQTIWSTEETPITVELTSGQLGALLSFIGSLPIRKLLEFDREWMRTMGDNLPSWNETGELACALSNLRYTYELDGIRKARAGTA